MEILRDILSQSILMFLWIGSIVGVVIGVGIWANPGRIVVINQYFSRWIGSDKIGTMLDRPRSTQRFFYRNHKFVGASVLIGALAVLYTFLFSYNLRTISVFVPRGFWWISDALVAILLLGSALAALVGGLVLLRPSLLREFENVANRWISSERFQIRSNQMNFSAEQALIRHHKVAGMVILFGSLYTVIILGSLLARGALHL